MYLLLRWLAQVPVVAFGAAGLPLRARPPWSLAWPDGGTAVNLPAWLRGLAAAVILRAGTEQNSCSLAIVVNIYNRMLILV